MARSIAVTRTIAVAALSLVLAAAAGCASRGETTVASAPPPGVTASPTGPQLSGSPTVAVPQILQFSVPMVGGGTFSGASLAGKPAMLWFWASWCPRCQAKASTIKAMHERYIGRVQVVGVAGLGSGDAGMRGFVATHGLSGFPNLADDNGEVWKRFGVTEQEYFVLIDAAGTVVFAGPLSPTDLDTRMATLAG